MGDEITLTDLQMDALKEAVNIGAGNAASALSKLAGSKVVMEVPRANVIPLSDIPDIVGTAAGPKILIRINVIGDAPGTILISMPMSSAKMLVDVVMERKPGDTKELSSMDLSVVQEVGNIMTGNYLRALETMTSMAFRSSVPYMAIEKDGDVVEGTLEEMARKAKYALVIESQMKEQHNEIEAKFFLVTKSESLNKILSVLGVGD